MKRLVQFIRGRLNRIVVPLAGSTMRSLTACEMMDDLSVLRKTSGDWRKSRCSPNSILLSCIVPVLLIVGGALSHHAPTMHTVFVLSRPLFLTLFHALVSLQSDIPTPTSTSTDSFILRCGLLYVSRRQCRNNHLSRDKYSIHFVAAHHSAACIDLIYSELLPLFRELFGTSRTLYKLQQDNGS